MLDDWLQDPSSLTQRFQQLANLKIRHRLIHEGWQPLSSREQDTLNSSRAWVRDITWQHQDTTLIYARSTIPEQTFKHSFNSEAIGPTSLGKILFGSCDLSYSNFEYKNLDASDSLYTLACKALSSKPATLTMRQRTFTYKNYPLIVQEIFLPKFYELIKTL